MIKHQKWVVRLGVKRKSIFQAYKEGELTYAQAVSGLHRLGFEVEVAVVMVINSMEKD